MALTTELRRATTSAQEQGTALLQRYYLDHPELMAGGAADTADFATRSVAVQEAAMALTPADFARLPSFAYREEGLPDILRRLAPGLVALLVSTVLVGVFAAARLRTITSVDR